MLNGMQTGFLELKVEFWKNAEKMNVKFNPIYPLLLNFVLNFFTNI